MKKTSRFPEIYVTLVLILMYLPILTVFVYSFNDTKLFTWEGFTLSWYKKLLSNTAIAESLKNSLVIALLSSALSALVGTFGAVGMSKTAFKAKGLIEDISLIPIMVPEIILGMAYLAFFTYLNLPFGMVTLVLGHTAFCVPYVYMNVKARLAGLDPSVGEAALDLGASRLRMFADITFPLILPAVASGSLLAFAMSMDDVVISFFTAGPNVSTLPLQVYSSLKTGVTPEINALCTLMLGSVFLIIALFNMISSLRRAASDRLHADTR